MRSGRESYTELLRRSASECRSIVCLGLDPKPEVYPFEELEPGERLVKVFETLLDKMISKKVVPAAVKPNIGYYHRLDRPIEGDFSGSLALARVLESIREALPGLPIILDAKRGDIATSSANYAAEAFESWRADAVTVAPYMGHDSISPFTSWCGNGRGVYILNRTSNPGGADVQNLPVAEDQSAADGAVGAAAADALGSEVKARGPSRTVPLYMRLAETIAETARESAGTGAVVGATNLGELGDLAAYFSDKEVPFLIPGVGGQGGSASETMRVLRERGYPAALARINSSSGLTHPWAKKKERPPADFAEVCVQALDRLNEEIAYEP